MYWNWNECDEQRQVVKYACIYIYKYMALWKSKLIPKIENTTYEINKYYIICLYLSDFWTSVVPRTYFCIAITIDGQVWQGTGYLLQEDSYIVLSQERYCLSHG